jgi:hypothetical protein
MRRHVDVVGSAVGSEKSGGGGRQMKRIRRSGVLVNEADDSWDICAD